MSVVFLTAKCSRGCLFYFLVPHMCCARTNHFQILLSMVVRQLFIPFPQMFVVLLLSNKSCVALTLPRQVFWQCVLCCTGCMSIFISDLTLCVGSPIAFTLATIACRCTVFKFILGRGMSTSTSRCVERSGMQHAEGYHTVWDGKYPDDSPSLNWAS